MERRHDAAQTALAEAVQVLKEQERRRCEAWLPEDAPRPPPALVPGSSTFAEDVRKRLADLERARQEAWRPKAVPGVR
jgi:hypothetical protein